MSTEIPSRGPFSFVKRLASFALRILDRNGVTAWLKQRGKEPLFIGQEMFHSSSPMNPHLKLSRLRSGLLLACLAAATSIFAAGEWSPPVKLQPQGSTYYPKPISDGQGGWMSCWYSFHPSTTGGSASVYTSRSTDGQTWSAPGFVHSDSYWPSLATDYKGRFLLAFQMSSSYLVGAVRTSTNFGSSWSPAVIVSGPQDGHASARQIATDGQGVWMVVGDKGTGSESSGKYWISVSTDNGQTWNWTDRGAGYGPGIESDRRGRWMLRWIDGAGNVKIAFSIDKGATWTSPKTLGRMVTGNAGIGTGISETFGRNGIWIVTWATVSAATGSGSDQDIVFCRSTDDGATWSAPQVMNSNAFSDSGHDYWPSLAGDGRGNWVVVWFTNEILHSCSTDDGVTWSAPQPLTAAESRGGFPVLATDNLGKWVCHWMRYSLENNYETFGSHMEFQVPQVTLVSPRDGKCVAGNRVLIKADIAPFPYSPRAGVMEFEYRPAGVSAWLKVPAAEAAHPNPDPNAPYFVHWDVSGLAGGDYELRAVARFGGTAALFSDPVTVTVSGNCGNGHALAADGTTEAWSETLSTTDTVIAAADCASSRSLEAVFAAASLPDGTTVRILFPSLSASSQASIASKTTRAAASFLAPVEVSFAGATNSSTPFELRLDYPDLLQDGVVDATDMLESSLRIHHLTPSGWKSLHNSVVDPVRNRVSVFVSEPGSYTLAVPTITRVPDWELYE